MIWVPYASATASTSTLASEHLMDVVFQGMQCLRDMYTEDVSGRDVRAWRQHGPGLIYYVLAAELEMRRRGLPGEKRVYRAFTWVARENESMTPKMPPWWGEPSLHESHRSHLISIDPEHYARRMPVSTRLGLKLLWPGERKLR